MKNKNLFEALALIEEEKGLPIDFILDKIKKSIITACKNSYNGNEDVIINIDDKKNKFEVYLKKTVVDEVMDSGFEISLSDARQINPDASIDDQVAIKLDTKEFGRIAAQTARNIIRQGIRDGERELMLQDFESKCQEIVTATVEKIDPQTGTATVKIGKSEAFLPKNEQMKTDKLHEGDIIKVYIVDVKVSDRGPRAIISRKHSGIIKKLFEAQVPEICDGTIEIKQVSREAGERAKVAVYSNNKDVDAIGACIGPKGTRINAVINELGGEKIDLIEYNEDPAKFIASALAPAEVLHVDVIESKKSSKAIVPDGQLSLAIGNKGQNARLAARLTGWKIDIKPVSKLND